MKKSFILSIIMFCIIGIFSSSVEAASASLRTSSSQVNIGENVSVTISFGSNVSFAQFTLNYDTNKLDYVSSSAGGFGASTKKFAYMNTLGEADLSSVTLTFKSKVTGTANFNLSGLKVTTETETKVTPTIGNSSSSITILEIKEPETKPEVKPQTKPNNSSNVNTNQQVSNNEVSTEDTNTNSVNEEVVDTNSQNTQNEENNVNQHDNETKTSKTVLAIILTVVGIVEIIIAIILIIEKNKLLKK